VPGGRASSDLTTDFGRNPRSPGISPKDGAGSIVDDEMSSDMPASRHGHRPAVRRERMTSCLGCMRSRESENVDLHDWECLPSNFRTADKGGDLVAGGFEAHRRESRPAAARDLREPWTWTS
jgi:hypothetical protein